MICVNAANIEKDFNYFKKFVDDFNCKLEDRSNDYSLVAIQGPESLSIVHSLYPDSRRLENSDY